REAGEDPALAALQPVAGGGEQRPDLLTAYQPGQHVRLLPAGQDDVGAAGRGQARRLELGDHAAGAAGFAAAGVGLDCGVDAVDAPDEDGVRVQLRVGRVQALAGHEDDQQVGVDQVRGQRRERVVLTDARLLKFLEGHDVVLVDDRHDLVLEERQERVARVEVTQAVRQVPAGKQRLGGDYVALGEEAVVGVHELALADGREDLAKGEGAGEAVGAEARPPRRYRPRADDDDVRTFVPELRYLRDQGLDPGHVQPLAAPGEEVGAQLDDNTVVTAARRCHSQEL